MRDSKCTCDLNSTLTESLLSPNDSILLFGCKTSRSNVYMIIGIRSTNFSSGSLAVVVITPQFLGLRIVVVREADHIWGTELEYIQPPEGHCPTHARYFQEASTVFQFSRGHARALHQASCFGVMKNILLPVDCLTSQ